MGEVSGGQAQQPADFFSTSSHFPPTPCSPSQTGCFPFSTGRPGVWHHTCSRGSSHCQPPTLHLPTRKVLVNKASVPQPRVHQQLGAQLDYVQPGSPGHFSLKHQIKALHSSSIPPQGSASFTFTVVCFSINNIPTSLVYFLKHLV